MPTSDDLMKEFEKIRARYLELLGELIKQRVPGVIDPVAAKCSVGEVCHGGEFLTAKDIATLPSGRG
jgi:hypothetical protein